MSCRHCAFPHRALCQLSVAHYCINTVILMIHFSGKSHSHTYRKPMSQRSRIHFYSRKLIIGMPDKFRAKFAEGINNLLYWEKAFLCKHSVKSLHRMSFAHYKTVAVRIIHIFRADIHLFKIKCYKCVDHTHISADMSGLSGTDHIDHVFAKIIRQSSQIFHHFHPLFPFLHSPRRYAFTSSSMGS